MDTKTIDALSHIRDSIHWILEDTKDFDFDMFRDNRKTRQAVERNVEIISEAGRRISSDI